MRARVSLLAVLFLLLSTAFAGCTKDEPAPPPVIEAPAPPPPPDPRTFVVGMQDCHHERQLILVEGPTYEAMLPEGWTISYNAQEPTQSRTFLEALISVCPTVTEDGKPMGNATPDALAGEIVVAIPVVPPAEYQTPENSSRDFFPITVFVQNHAALLQRWTEWGVAAQEAAITIGPFVDDTAPTPVGAGLVAWTSGSATYEVKAAYDGGMLPFSPRTYAGGHWRLWLVNGTNVSGQLLFEEAKTQNQGFGAGLFTSSGSELFPERSAGGWTRAFDVDSLRHWHEPDIGWPGLLLETQRPTANNTSLPLR